MSIPGYAIWSALALSSISAWYLLIMGAIDIWQHCYCAVGMP